MTEANPRPQPTLLLSSADLAALMRPADYLAAVESGFLALRDSRAASPPPMHIEARAGAFHAKAASLDAYAALKLNGNFPDNPRAGLPTIQGAILLCDAENGAVLAIMDSIEITLRRTAAATALAARQLAKPGATSVAICGCGAQAPAQLEALLDVLPLTHGFAWDVEPGRARAVAATASERFGLVLTPTSALREATRAADVIVTCTTARTPFLDVGDVAPGAFIAAVGADNPRKNEIAPSLMAAAAIVADVREQCAVMGDLRAAIAAGALTAEAVRGELADVLAGACGRESAEEIIIFDSTGTAVQDVASASLAYERARAAGRGVSFTLAGV
jgi:ornithine cyclodeaminase/alanine dehydrogenase-like protein (mu-crystallin family)